MFSSTKLASLAVLVAVVGVHAQTTVPPNISQCVITCVTQAAAAGGCSSITDLSCVCTSQAFQSAALQCLTSTCTAADQQAALALQQQECATTSGSSASTGPTSAASSASSAVSSASSAASSASSAASSASKAASSASSAASSASKAASSASSAASGASSAGASGSAPAPSGSASQTGNSAFAVAPLNINGLAGLGVAVVAALAGTGLVL